MKKTTQTQTSQALIQEIHNAFDGAQDVLLEEALEIIKTHTVDNTDHVERMAKLGFTNSKTVTEATEKLQTAVKTSAQAKTVLYYKETYPFQKFLTTEKLDQICEKYGLIYAPVDRYLEDVPAKNLAEIEKAKTLLSKDQPSELWEMKIRESTDCKFSKKDKAFIAKWRGEDTPSGMEIANMLPSRKLTWTEANRALSFERVRLEGLFIAAPKHHFNLDGLSKKGTLGFFKTEKADVDDPIVFRYVRDGIQVLSKWGLEASDPELANPLDN